MRFTFPSLRNANIRYAIYANSADNPGYDWMRSSGIISQHLASFDTMGDGEVQHTPEFCPRVGDTLDVLESLFMVVDQFPRDNRSEFLDNFWRHSTPSDQAIHFAAGIRYKEGKRHWYTFREDMRVSSAESKRHDKRWSEVLEYHDGSFDSTVGILLGHDAPLNFIYHLGTAFRVSEVLDDHYGLTHYLKQLDALRDYSNEQMRRLIDAFKRINTFHAAVRDLTWVLNCRQQLAERAAAPVPA